MEKCIWIFLVILVMSSLFPNCEAFLNLRGNPGILCQENLLISDYSGLFGGCSCPCRTYTVKQCVRSYEERLDKFCFLFSYFLFCFIFLSLTSCYYDGYGAKKCEKVPIISSKYVKETECQKCQEMTETEMVESTKL